MLDNDTERFLRNIGSNLGTDPDLTIECPMCHRPVSLPDGDEDHQVLAEHVYCTAKPRSARVSGMAVVASSDPGADGGIGETIISAVLEFSKTAFFEPGDELKCTVECWLDGRGNWRNGVPTEDERREAKRIAGLPYIERP